MTERKLCPKCNGRGEYFFDDHCQGMWVECDMCKGFGVYPLTEQEWIQMATTEQLAEYILNVWLDGALNVNAEFGLNEAQIEQHKGYIVEWLKQPHREEK